MHILLVGKEGQPYLTSYISSLFFHFLFEFYINKEGKKSMMDHIEVRGRDFVVVA